VEEAWEEDAYGWGEANEAVRGADTCRIRPMLEKPMPRRGDGGGRGGGGTGMGEEAREVSMGTEEA